MNPTYHTAAAMGSIIASGGAEVSKGLAAGNYHPSLPIATETYAAISIAGRFGLTMALAAEVCRMAGIGDGRRA